MITKTRNPIKDCQFDGCHTDLLIFTLLFTPTIDISETSTVTALVPASFTLVVAVGSVVDCSPHTAADVHVSLYCILRRRDDHQECEAHQQQHWLVALRHVEVSEVISWSVSEYCWCFSRSSTDVDVTVARIYMVTDELGLLACISNSFCDEHSTLQMYTNSCGDLSIEGLCIIARAVLWSNAEFKSYQ